jgi:hypothetical protein
MTTSRTFFPLLFTLAIFLVPLSAQAHIVAHTLDVSGIEANYSTGIGSITFTDDGLSCGGGATFVVFYLTDPTSGEVVSAIDATGAPNISGGRTRSEMFAADTSYALSNNYAYDLDAAYFTKVPSGSYAVASGLQADLPSACATENVDSMTFNDLGLALGTRLTLGAPTYNTNRGNPSAQIPYADDFGWESYEGLIFEPSESDPLSEGANGSQAGGFDIRNTSSPWDWWLSSNPGTAFVPAEYGTYTFAIVSQNSNCARNGGTLATCSPDFLASEAVALDGPDVTPPAISPQSDIKVDTTDSSGAVVSYATPAATDDRDGTDAVSCAPTSGSLFAIGTSVVTCTAADAAGNTSISTFNVVVGLVAPPAPPAAPVTAPPVASGGGGSIIAATQGPLVSDSFGGEPTGLLPSPLRITPAPPGYQAHSSRVLAASIGPVAMAAPSIGAGQLAAIAAAPGIDGLGNWFWLLPCLLLGAFSGWGYARISRIYGK